MFSTESRKTIHVGWREKKKVWLHLCCEANSEQRAESKALWSSLPCCCYLPPSPAARAAAISQSYCSHRIDHHPYALGEQLPTWWVACMEAPIWQLRSFGITQCWGKNSSTKHCQVPWSEMDSLCWFKFVPKQMVEYLCTGWLCCAQV